jgi:hypothetical protein
MANTINTATPSKPHSNDADASTPVGNQPPEVTQTPTITPRTSRPGFVLGANENKRQRVLFGSPASTTGPTASTTTPSNTSSTNKAWVHKVYPCSINDPDMDMSTIPLPFSGFVVAPCVPFGDTLIAGIPYSTGPHGVAAKKQFFSINTCIPVRVITTKDPSTGLKRVYTSKSNNKVYDWKAISYVTDKDSTLTDDNIQKFINGKLKVTTEAFFAAAPHVNKFKVNMNVLPYMGNMTDETHVFAHERWSDVVNEAEDIVFIIRHALIQYSKNMTVKPTFKQWLESDPRHIYTLWAPGKIPREIIIKYNLTEKAMTKADWTKHMSNLQSIKDAQENVNANAAAQTAGNNNDWGDL